MSELGTYASSYTDTPACASYDHCWTLAVLRETVESSLARAAINGTAPTTEITCPQVDPAILHRIGALKIAAERTYPPLDECASDGDTCPRVIGSTNAP